MESNRRITVIIAGAVVFLLLLLIIYTLSQRTAKVAPETGPGATIVPGQVNPTQIKERVKKLIPKRPDTLPTIAPGGKGIDTQATDTQASAVEVQKLQQYLPYSAGFVTADGTTMRVYVPPRTSSDNPWTLRIEVIGVDYQVPKNSPGFTREKTAFLQGATMALEFIKSHGVDPGKISVVWGSRKFMQDRATEWLNN